MLFQQSHAIDGHAAVHGFAHVIDREQGHLHGGQGFHLDTRLADGFGRGGANHAASILRFHCPHFLG